MNDSEPSVVEEPFAPRTYLATMPRWKKGLVGGAVVMLIAAVVFMTLEDPAPAATGTGTPGAMASTLVGGAESPPAGSSQIPQDVPWSEAFFKFGFSFFVGFAIGYAVRAFLKFVLFLAGGLAIFLFVMSYYQWVDVNWDAIDASFTEFGRAVKGQFGAFRSFITGSLPNAGLAGLGLFTGFKKNA